MDRISEIIMYMKIKKLSLIKNIGSFKEFEWDKFCRYKIGNGANEIVTLEKKNVLFGDNGNGKSTIVKILKSLNSHISSLPKNWSMIEKEQSVILGTDSGEVVFSETGWDSQIFKGKIHVFDREFIRDNV